jgi:pimeloyl-ACP methyl ester carboxylesterase
MQRALLCCATLAAGLLAGMLGCASLPPAERAATSFGERAFLRAGAGEPTVVFEAGLGDGKDSWALLIGELRDTTRVFAYDRAGYGGSPARDGVRSGAQVVEELRAVLRAAGVQPPYVLVGHSLGGSFVELYARQHPREVAGVVLIDSRHEAFSQRCHDAGALVCEPPALLAALMPGSAADEYRAASTTMQQLRNAGPFPEVPLVVLTGMRKLVEGPTFNRVWLDTQRELAHRSPQARHEVCESCGHYVHRDRPELVVRAIRDVVRDARANRTQR